ncbi:MAG: aminoglycoside phosphotransferase family protein [Cyclobacteriaceae bacterium]|nr:aminoglycoside phosphotransferase family protein [Cyclobacteriaceae bacterium]
MAEVAQILQRYHLDSAHFKVERIGSGHIHATYKLTGPRSYVLQRVNKNVFTQPELIASNLRRAADYLKWNSPDYLFPTVIPSAGGKEMEYDEEGFPWRLFPYIDNTITIDSVSSADQATQAAMAFGRLSRLLDKADVSSFHPTIPRFHDLALRKVQFEEALTGAGDRAQPAAQAIESAKRFFPLVDEYEALIRSGSLKERIVHNDTKINNVLFDRTTGKTVAVIDLDTLMPGYFIYDLGDMVRTFVCPVSEEEQDFSRIAFRKEIYEALVEGYLSEMGPVMTEGEKASLSFAGRMMTYIMALRFLADYLRGNTYYHITYPEQNLVRAGNQLRLLEILSENLG